MDDTMRPIEHKSQPAKDHFWLQPPQRHILPNGEPSHTHVPRGETCSHPTLDYEVHREQRLEDWKQILAVSLPFGRRAVFDLASFPIERWENLVDDAGNQIPLRINVHGGRVAGQWLPDPGIVPPSPTSAVSRSSNPPHNPFGASPPTGSTASPLPSILLPGNLLEPNVTHKPDPSVELAEKLLRQERELGRKGWNYVTSSYFDPTFNGSGVVFASRPGEPWEARGLCVQRDGRIVVVGAVGTVETGRKFGVVRFLADGRLDDGFGRGGHAVIGFDDSDAVGNAVAQVDGKLIVAGEVFDLGAKRSDFVLVRLGQDGHVEESFGDGGLVRTGFPDRTDSGAYGVVVQPERKIVAAGYTTRRVHFPGKKRTPNAKSRSKKAQDPMPTEHFALARYDEDGRLDTSFGTDGLVMTPFEGNDVARAQALALHPKTGEIIVAGFVRSSPDDPASEFAIVRYDSDGGLDARFWVDPAGVAGVAQAVAVGPDGGIVVAGSDADKDANDHYVVFRLDHDGSLDTTFGRGGAAANFLSYQAGVAEGVAAATQAWRYAASGAYAVALDDRDGAILAAGYGTFRDRKMFAVARSRPSGWWDDSFGVEGVMLLDLGGDDDSASAIAVDGDGRILVAGTSRTAERTQFALARLLPDPSGEA